MSNFINIHVLISHSPSCLNRGKRPISDVL